MDAKIENYSKKQRWGKKLLFFDPKMRSRHLYEKVLTFLVKGTDVFPTLTVFYLST